MRRKSLEVKIGNKKIGGENPVLVQSMTTAYTQDAASTIAQINELSAAGADIVRFTVPDMKAAENVAEIKANVKVPIVADIHFDYRLALKSIEGGIDKIRINPGNIGDKERVRLVAEKCMERKVPIRIGVNAGSLEREFCEKYGNTPRAMVESAKYHVSLLEECGMKDIVISLKASDVPKTYEAYKMMAEECDYPLHLGVTEAGTEYGGIIKSAAGIGGLLLSGIGDTIRVSLTANPVEEVRAGKALLAALNLSKSARLVSCPTCGRCRINLFPIAKAVEKRLETVKAPITVAVMGCAVNGPGEAREADFGIAGGDNCAVLFKKGEIIRKLPESEILNVLFEEIEKADKNE
ncbi:MAG: flavodoxin-dependent (E)-4-hydroxy-3-methylbut-2-enyl-diphosphate synthase [Clostridia bacterium]|nr:flavodoxin-dependent (E)-4-hydroxy-3-methylbut-2-enyl-diphosphate synthase [Clostridia bacterium]